MHKFNVGDKVAVYDGCERMQGKIVYVDCDNTVRVTQNEWKDSFGEWYHIKQLRKLKKKIKIEKTNDLTFAEALFLLTEQKAKKIRCYVWNAFWSLSIRDRCRNEQTYEVLTFTTASGHEYNYSPTQPEMLKYLWTVIE